MNETINAILNRYTCRAYTDDAVAEPMVEAMISAALAAPTAMNRQPYRVAVVTDKTVIDKMDSECMETIRQMPDPALYERMMARGGKVFYNAPVMFMLPVAQGSQVDVGIVAQNIVLAAASLGLGSCHCGMARLIFDSGRKEKYEALFGFPKGYEFGLAVLVGHSATAGKPHEVDMGKVIRIK